MPDKPEQESTQDAREAFAQIAKLQRAMERLAKFPTENTNPVLRIDRHGVIRFCNKPGHVFLRESEHGPEPLRQLRAAATQSLEQKRNLVVDVPICERIFSFSVVPVGEELYANLYGSDITQMRRMQARETQHNHDVQNSIGALLRLTLDHTASVDDILQTALSLILDMEWLAPAARGSVFLVEDEPDVLVMRVWQELEPTVVAACATLPFGKCLCGRAAAEQVVQFADCVDDRHEGCYEGLTPHGHYCIPIIWQAKTLGVINIYLREGHIRSTWEESFLTSIADTVAGAIMWRRAEDSIRKYRDDLRRLTTELYLAEERERKALSTALHDSVSQDLVALQLKLAEMHQAEGNPLEEQLNEANDMLKQAIKQTRALTFELSPPILYEFGLPHALRWLGGQFEEQYGVVVNITGDRAGLPDATRVLVYQSVRELLANVRKHAQAHRVEIALQGDDGQMRITVQDDGRGFDVEALVERRSKTVSIGLFSIEERMRHLGGSVDFESSPDKGTRVTLTVPVG